LGNLSTPKTVQKLQKALHAKAKAEAEYRFYALYDKISREDILAFPWNEAPRYMIRDRDRIYGAVVTRKPTAPASPWQNGLPNG
jgi:hypothetical protein